MAATSSTRKLSKKLLKVSEVEIDEDKTETKLNRTPLRGTCNVIAGIPSVLKGTGTKRTKVGLPPVLDLTPHVHKTYRYLVGTTTAATVSIAEIAGALGGICTVTNTTVVSWVSSFRIKSITVWPTAASSGQLITLLEWVSGGQFIGFVPDESINLTMPDGTTMPGALVFKPPKKSLAGNWISVAAAGSENLFSISAVAGSVVDLEVEYTLPIVNSTTSTLISNTVATGILGGVYYLALDGASNNKIAPVTGYPTTH